MINTIIEIENLRAGQPRRYADSIYSSKIHSRNFWNSTTGPREGTWHLKEKEAKILTKMFVHDFVEGPEREWHDGQLTQFEQDSNGTWHVTVTVPYTD